MPTHGRTTSVSSAAGNVFPSTAPGAVHTCRENEFSLPTKEAILHRLPNEVLTKILHFVAEDTLDYTDHDYLEEACNKCIFWSMWKDRHICVRDLRCLCLVSRRLLPIAQRLLFRQVWLKWVKFPNGLVLPDTSVIRLHKVLLTKPELRRNIKAMEIVIDEQYDGLDSPALTDFYIMQDFAQWITNVKCLYIRASSCINNKKSLELARRFEKCTQSLEHLVLAGQCWKLPYGQVVGNVLFPRVRTLELQYISACEHLSDVQSPVRINQYELFHWLA
jgi:hypothetical protein